MKITVLLDDIRSAYNVGSIFRTADAAGVEKIFCCGITPSPLNRFGKVRRDVAKVSLGAEATVVWEYAKDIKTVIATFKRDGWQIVALEQAEGAISYAEARMAFVTNKEGDGKIALIVGNEVMGVVPEILSLADQVIEIPMRGKKESLNVSVAFGIAIFGLL